MMQWVDYSDGAHSLQKVHSRSLRGAGQRKNITPLPSSASRHSGVFGFGYVTASGRALFFSPSPFPFLTFPSQVLAPVSHCH